MAEELKLSETSEEHTVMYDTLLGQGIPAQVCSRLDKIHLDGLLSVDELDDRALEALKEFSPEDALHVLEQFTKSDLSHVQNKSAFLCGVMKTYRAKMKTAKDTPCVSATDVVTSADESKKGPNEEKVKELLDRTGYTLDITTGQRKYGGPPPDWDGPVPGTGEKVSESLNTLSFVVYFIFISWLGLFQCHQSICSLHEATLTRECTLLSVIERKSGNVGFLHKVKTSNLSKKNFYFFLIL